LKTISIETKELSVTLTPKTKSDYRKLRRRLVIATEHFDTTYLSLADNDKFYFLLQDFDTILNYLAFLKETTHET